MQGNEKEQVCTGRKKAAGAGEISTAGFERLLGGLTLA